MEIAFQGVGSGTQVDHIQVHMNADDGVEFFGGTVEVSHVLVTGVGDDSLDWTDGWSGGAQYVILHQHDDNGDNGIEGDNNGEANDASPRSAPVLSNLTIIGSPDSDDSDLGILVREGTAAKIYNTVVVGFNDACLDIDHEATWNQAASGDLLFDGVHINCETSFKADDDADNGLLVDDIFAQSASNSTNTVELVSPFNLTAPDYSLNVTGLSLGAVGADFVGAIGSDDWTAGWTTHELN